MDTQDSAKHTQPAKWEVLPYEPHAHLSSMEAWLRLRKMPSFLAYQLPEVGRVCHFEGAPIAMAFLRRIEACSVVILDSLITDPEALPEVRNQAIDWVLSSLLETARSLNLDQVIADSVDRNTLARSLRHGFQHLPNTMMGIQLSSEGNTR